MSAKTVLEEFRRRRKLLENLRPTTATARLGEMWNFLNNTPETKEIIKSITSVETLIKAGKAKDAKTYEEIAGVGIHILQKCHEGEHITKIVGDLDIGVKQPRPSRQSFTNDAGDFVKTTFDYVERELEELVEEEQKGHSKYGEGKYGEGVYGGNEVNETNQKNRALGAHTALQNDFIKFLEGKGYSDHFEDIVKKGRDIDLCVTDDKDSKPIAIFEFKLTSDDKTLFKATRQLISFCEEGILGKPDPFMYIVCPSHDKSSEPFEIYEVIDNGYESLLSINDFPAYEDLRRKMVTKTKASVGEGADDEDFRNVFRENLIAFLINEKKFPRESLNHGILAEAPDLDLTVTHPDTDESLAVFDCKSGHYGKPSPEVSESMANAYKSGLVGIQNPFAYIVQPSEESNEEFVIFEVEDDGTSNEISYEDFPIYDQLLFASPLSAPGRRIYRNLIRLAKDKHGFSVHTPCQDYIDLQIKKNKRNAAQIHRLNDSDENIALVLAGYQKDFPEAKLPNYMFEGELKQLSGYTNKYPGEKNWLEGNLGHQQLKYEAGVYILRPGALVLDEIENEVGDLLELAKGNAEKEKGFEISGHAPTMIDDKEGVKDLLGRAGLVEALANMFVYSKEMEGFTVALFGNWGEGKSTMMKLLEEHLKEHHRKRFVFAKFKAWEYEKTDNIAAGMALEVVKGLKKSFNFLCRITLYVCFIAWEHSYRFIWSVIKFGLAVLPFILLYFFRGQLGLTEQQDKIIKDFLGISLAGAGSIAIGLYVLKNFKHIVEHPLVTNLETFLKLPNYGKHLGLIPVLKRHIKKLCILSLKAGVWKWRWGKDRKLIVFVDDLDRCQPKCIADTLDAIRLVMENPNVIVFIGIDHRIAFKAIGEHYKNVGDSERRKGEIARDYLGKIIQLPIRLQEPTVRGLEEFINERLFPNTDGIEKTPKMTKTSIFDRLIVYAGTGGPIMNFPAHSDSGGISSRDETESATNVLPKEDSTIDITKTSTEEITEEEMQDTKDERDEFFDMAKKCEFTNPRQLLRLRNCYRLIKALELQKARKKNQEPGFEKLKSLMRMLFWQEFLHNRPKRLRKACVKVLYENVDAEKISDEQTKVIIKQVKNSIIESFSDKKIYDKMAEDVRIVVLPHSQED